MKKVFIIVLALFMVLSLSGVAFADETLAGSGSGDTKDNPTDVVYNAGANSYILTYPQEVIVGTDPVTVTVTGTWNPAQTLIVNADTDVRLNLTVSETVTQDSATAIVNFATIQQAGHTSNELTATSTISVTAPTVPITVGTWKGQLNFTVRFETNGEYVGQNLDTQPIVTISGAMPDGTYKIVKNSTADGATKLEASKFVETGSSVSVMSGKSAAVILAAGNYALVSANNQYWSFTVSNENGPQPVDATGGFYLISTKADLFAFANDVNVNDKSYEEQTIYLGDSIDLNNDLWTPIGQSGDGYTEFLGTFDGQNNTISNLKVDSSLETKANHCSGLFGWVDACTIKNVIIENADVTGTWYAAALVGYVENSAGHSSIENCKVMNSQITAKGGDAVGALIGLVNDGAQLADCSAEQCTVIKIAATDIKSNGVGQLVGTYTDSKANFEAFNGLSASYVTVTIDGEQVNAPTLVGYTLPQQ